MPNIRDINTYLNNGNISKDESFALDTNVLIWTFYSKASINTTYQTQVYPNFIQHLISSGNKIYITAVNLNELFHFIEKNEFDLFNQGLSEDKKLGRKKFRSISSERSKVKSEISLIYKQLNAITNICIVGSSLEIDKLNKFLDEYKIHRCDFFDYYLIDFCNKNNISIVTDDIDFNTGLNLVNLYSANPKLIKVI